MECRLRQISSPHCRVKFAPFNSLLGQEVQHDASGRLIHEDEGQIYLDFYLGKLCISLPGETMEAFAESHFHDDKIELEEVRGD